GRHSRGLGSSNAAAEHRDLRWRDPWNAAEQNAAPAVLALKSNASRLGREPSCDLAHRREEWEAMAIRPQYRFIGNGGAAGGQQSFCLGEISRKMQKSKQD